LKFRDEWDIDLNRFDVTIFKLGVSKATILRQVLSAEKNNVRASGTPAIHHDRERQTGF